MEDAQNGMNGYEEVEEEYEEEEQEGEGNDERRKVRESTAMAVVDDKVDSIANNSHQAKEAASSDSGSIGKIFVGGIAWETTDETFRAYFSKYGEITDSVIMIDKHTRKPRGFGFVTFADPSVIDRVFQDEHSIDGRVVEVKRTVPRKDPSAQQMVGPKTRKIFVGGLPASLTEDELKEHFSRYGNITEHVIMVDKDSGRSRGFGFITFESEEAVEKVVSHGTMHEIGGKRVEIKKAEPKRSDPQYNGGGRSSYSSGGNTSRRSSSGASSYGGYGSGTGNSYRSSASAGYGYGSQYGSAYGSAAGYGSGAGYGYGTAGRGGYGYGGNATAGYGTGYGGYGGYGYGTGYGGMYDAGAGYGYGGTGYGGAGTGYGYGTGGGTGGGTAGGYSGGGGGGGGRGSGRYHPYGSGKSNNN